MPPRSRHPVAHAVVSVLAISLVLGACSSGTDHGAATKPTVSTARPTAGTLIALRPLHVQNQQIVDDRGRQILLRGANVNALGEYAQADPATKPTAPVTDADWDSMAANGFSVVRLIMSWSLLEPERGKVDETYLKTVKDTVRAANERGIYVVLDVHQDAWSMFSATPHGTTCPAGTEPARGWDGAPKWATITDGATTCIAPGAERESAPAVERAFANLYANTDGIADQLTNVWATLAGEFADVPGVAGYDLLNEPNLVEPLEENQVAYSKWMQRTIDAIRAAEKRVRTTTPKPIFAEALQVYPMPNNALLPQYLHDANLVFAPHNYGESIDHILTTEQTFTVDQQGADELHAPLWIGEYGIWNTKPASLDIMTRFAEQQDSRMVGGTWWQWRQTCGDPHSVAGPGKPATADQVHLITRACTPHAGAKHDTDLRDTEQFLRILGRSYPRAAPGHLTALTSDIATGKLTTAGSGATQGSQLVVWLPTIHGATPKPSVAAGLTDVVLHTVDGGRLLTATATGGDWSLAVG
jgi:endoglycosylceramidase